MLFILAYELVGVEENLCSRSKMDAVLAEIDALLFLVPLKGGIFQINSKHSYIAAPFTSIIP